MAVYILGDLHGNFELLQQLIKEGNLENDTIIQVGDFGVGYASFLDDLAAMEQLNFLLVNTNSCLYVLRGNHDNPAYFRGAAPRALDQSNIWFVADYSVLEVHQQRFLLVGGAISIDRKVQKEGEGYWQAEEFVYNEQIIRRMGNIDVVVTHSAPDFAPPFVFSDLVHKFAQNDSSLITNLHRERAELAAMYQCLKQNPTNRLIDWFYGHFHVSRKLRYENTRMVLVGMNEFLKLGS